VNIRALELLFSLAKDRKQAAKAKKLGRFQVQFTVSCVQIHKNVIKDLLGQQKVVHVTGQTVTGNEWVTRKPPSSESRSGLVADGFQV